MSMPGQQVGVIRDYCGCVGFERKRRVAQLMRDGAAFARQRAIPLSRTRLTNIMTNMDVAQHRTQQPASSQKAPHISWQVRSRLGCVRARGVRPFSCVFRRF